MRVWKGLLVFGLLAVAAPAQAQAAATKSLYDRLGGQTAVTAVVDDFVAKVAADKRINGYFAKANIPSLKFHLVEQICQASGGPCTYTGRDMKTAHAGLGITTRAFNALVGDLVATLVKFKVKKHERGDLLALLAPMKKDIVEKK